MLRTALAYGAIGGLIAGGLLSIVVLNFEGAVDQYGMAIGYLIMLIGLSTIFIAIKRQRDVTQGGVIRFLPAFGLGLGISLVAGIVYTLCWDAALHMIGIDAFVDKFAGGALQGKTGAELASAKAELESFRATYHNPFLRLPITFSEIFPVGAIVSLVSAGLLRNSRFLPARAAEA
ncbi:MULTISPECIES: DUF4199 domain-containing protein [unclassified Sphingomonas]|uniref:DUF4199 domain-containing protein n=1 Tax=Sphingomonas TaxID=13687 RepID=UPI00095E77FB|nr:MULTISPECIES: DUF4199 domain-containing protein [unclassified Sphingomonas]MBN8812279.1 DUF4199 domain-containing protein [Sphingomonas sp.]OJY47978.1 MAG: hypothetical protein BGP17_02180 [Sphingomonas sp. 67-41]